LDFFKKVIDKERPKGHWGVALFNNATEKLDRKHPSQLIVPYHTLLNLKRMFTITMWVKNAEGGVVSTGTWEDLHNLDSAEESQPNQLGIDLAFFRNHIKARVGGHNLPPNAHLHLLAARYPATSSSFASSTADDDEEQQTIVRPSNFLDERWHFVALVVHGGHALLFVDGQVLREICLVDEAGRGLGT
jgi:hypothetical protein